PHGGSSASSWGTHTGGGRSTETRGSSRTIRSGGTSYSSTSTSTATTVPASAPATRPDGPASSRGSCTCSRPPRPSRSWSSARPPRSSRPRWRPPSLRSRARREREGAPMQNLLRVLLLLLLLLLTFLAPAPAFAANAVGPAPVAPPPATIKFFNRDIVTLRASYYGVLPADRAAQAANRIREAVARDGPGAVKMVTTPEGLNVTI